VPIRKRALVEGLTVIALAAVAALAWAWAVNDGLLMVVR
jgi:hypothetical protein